MFFLLVDSLIPPGVFWRYFCCNETSRQEKYRAVCPTSRNFLKREIPNCINPFTARVKKRVLWGGSNFWVCGWKPMVWPFKWNLSTYTFTRYYLVFKILKWNLDIFADFCPWPRLAVKGLRRCRRYNICSMWQRAVKNIISAVLTLPFHFRVHHKIGMINKTGSFLKRHKV